MKVYVIANGIKKGFYFSWNDVEPLVIGFSGAQHKSFKQINKAIQWLKTFEKITDETIP